MEVTKLETNDFEIDQEEEVQKLFSCPVCHKTFAKSRYVYERTQNKNA